MMMEGVRLRARQPEPLKHSSRNRKIVKRSVHLNKEEVAVER